MTKSKRNKHLLMKGGFLESLTNTISNLSSSISQGANNLWQKTKQTNILTQNSTPSSYTNTTNTLPNTTNTLPNTTNTYGGKTKKRYFKGGFTPTSGIAKNASSFYGKTAQPHNWVGGKTRRNRNKQSRRKKHYKHTKY